MRIRLITVGRISGPFREILDRYKRMISRFADLEIFNLGTGGDLNREDRGRIKLREARRISGLLKGKVILLDERGRELDSIGFSRFLEDSLGRDLSFVIGGPLGVHESIREVSDEVISLSRMTLSHEIASIVLAEQIFRAFKIMRGERYHY